MGVTVGVSVSVLVGVGVGVSVGVGVGVFVTPAQMPLVQTSLTVFGLPSLQAVPVSGVTEQVDVPLHARVLHWSEAHVIGVPAHWPEASQVSPYVQAVPSVQLVP